MKLVAVGDSFTYGEELSDINNAWPFLLGNKLGYKVNNMAKPGSGNSRMVRHVVEQVLSDKPDLVVIGWSSPGRIEFADEDGFFDTWPGYSGRSFFAEQQWREQLVRYINEHHNEKLLHRQFLFDLILLQSFLKNNNVVYAMTHTDPSDFYHKSGDIINQDLLNNIDRTKFVDGYEKGMVVWAHGKPKGERGHFLEEGHQIVAEKFYEHIRNISGIS